MPVDGQVDLGLLLVLLGCPFCLTVWIGLSCRTGKDPDRMVRVYLVSQRHHDVNPNGWNDAGPSTLENRRVQGKKRSVRPGEL